MGKHFWLVALVMGPLLACGSTSSPSDASGAGTAGNAGSAGDTGSAAGDAGSDAGAVHLGGGSWDVTARIDRVNLAGEHSEPCTSEFTLNFDGKTLTVGHEGEMHSAAARVVDGAYVADDIELPKSPFCVNRLHASELRLVGVDSDGDGEADRLEASQVMDKTYQPTGDTGFEVTPSIQLTAVPDATDPALAARVTEFYPLARLGFSVSEPVAATSTLTLTGTSSVELLPFRAANDAPADTPFNAFYTDEILPLGGTWQLTGSVTDLAGRAAMLGMPIHSAPDPGVQAQDGFEGTFLGTSAGAKLSTGYGTVPPLTGTQSLWLEREGYVMLHLQRSGNERKLRFTLRGFSAAEKNPYLSKNVTAGVVGGTHVVSLASLTPPAELVASPSGDATLPWVTSKIEMEADLEDEGTDVLLGIVNEACWNAFQCMPRSAWLIDDLRLE